MALDATVGGVSANSYVTLSEAEAYFKDRAHVAVWNALAYDARANFLITASRMLDWYSTWKGDKVSYTQSMDWPRTEVLYPDGTDYPSNIIPSEVKVAVFELALSSVETDRSADQDLDGLAEIRAGSLTLKTDSSLRGRKPNPIPDKVKNIISAFVSSAGIGVVRLMRA